MGYKGVRMMVTTPSGKCPHLLEGTDEDSVRNWIKKVKCSAPTGVVYQPSALRYWIRDTYDINGTEYKIAANMFDSLFDC